MSIHQDCSTPVEMPGFPRAFVGAVQAATQLPARGVGVFLNWRQKVKMDIALRRLDERLLRDIGLTKADVAEGFPASPPDFFSRPRI